MKKKLIKNKYYILLLALYFIFPIKAYAYNYCTSHSGYTNSGSANCKNTTYVSGCGGAGSFGTHTDGSYGQYSYYGTHSNCRSVTTANSDSDIFGFPSCAVDGYLGEVFNSPEKVYDITDPANINKKLYKKITIGIMNTWSLSGSGNGWNKLTGINEVACPNSEIWYTSSYEIPWQLKNKTGLRVKSVRMLLNWEDLAPYYSGDVLNNLHHWSLANNGSSLELLENGDASDGYYSVTTHITKLESNATEVGGLGMNGRVKDSFDYLRTYHYFIPFETIFEYDNDDVDKCENQQYAYENPTECCDRNKYPKPNYPEACCSDINLIKELHEEDPSNGYLDFCCTGAAKVPTTTQAYYGNGKTLLNTFAAYFYNKPESETGGYRWEHIYNEDGSGVCPACKNPEDFYPTNDGKGSMCCQSNPGSEYASNCKSKCDVTKCGIDFENNKSCCCDLEEYKNSNKCENVPDDSWANNLSCKKANSDDNFAASGTFYPDGEEGDSAINEYVKFKNYKTLEEMQNGIIKAGTGFDYPITVEHTITREYKGSVWFDSNDDDFKDCHYSDGSLDTNCISSIITSKINNATTYGIGYDANNNTYNLQNDINGIKNTIFSSDDDNKKAFKFIDVESSEQPSEDYVLKDGGTIESKPVEVEQPTSDNVGFTYSYCNYTSCFDQNYYLKIPLKRTYKYTYTMNLKKKYINKTNWEIKSDGVSSTDIDYLDGEYKHYTSTRAKTGIYDFKITIENSGITGKLNSTDIAFSCQYGLYNELYENGKICRSTGVPTPCPNDNDDNGNGRGFYFRQISLTKPFATRTVEANKVGRNWKKYYDKTKNGYEYINFDGSVEKNDAVYAKKPLYSLHLTPSIISEIKKYNRYEESDARNNKGYLDWDTMKSSNFNDVDSISSFWTNDSNDVSSLPKITWIWNDKYFYPDQSVRQNKIGDFKKVGES